MTLLMLAARNGHEDVIFMLSKRGRRLNLVDVVSVHVHVLYCKAQVSLF